MKNWMKFLETLAGKLTAILAFAALIIVILALIGDRIPADYRALVYAVAIGAMLIFAFQIFMRGRRGAQAASPGRERETVGRGDGIIVDSSKARADYLNAVIADCRALRLVGIDPQASDPSRGGLTLESLYTSLDTTTMVDREGKGKPGRQRSNVTAEAEAALLPLRDRDSKPLSALEALFSAEDGGMVLLGLPGTGKSTFVRYLALRMAQAETDRSKNIQELLPGWKSGAILPLIVSLGRLAESIPSDRQKGSALLIENFIEQTLKTDERMCGFAGSILVELKQVGGLVLFDGLDEVANLEMRPIVVQAIEDFVQTYGHRSSRFLVTCRTYSYRNDARWQLTGWPTHELALLDDEKIRYFVNAWHDEHIRIDPARRPDLERKRERLFQSLQPDDRRRLHEIAPYPIILTMMAVVHTHYGELPDTRAEVYDRCVDLLLVRWELERPVMGQPQKTQKRTIVDELEISRVVLDRALWEIAFKAHEGRGDESNKERGPALVTGELLTGILSKHFQQDFSRVRIFLDYCQSSNGLLMLQGTVAAPGEPAESPRNHVYAFPHLTFEEFLAARHLIRPNFGKTTFELVKKDDRWREVVMLLGENLCFVYKDQERMEILLKALTPEKLPSELDSSLWRAVWYAGDLLTLYRRAFPSQASESDSNIHKALQKLVFKGALSPAERASAADTLDELGYTPADLYAFVHIAGRDGVPPFWISKYPVTNAQYERFLKRENFENKELWCNFEKFDENSQPMDENWGEQGWKWLQEALKDENYEAQDGALLPHWWREARFGANRPHAPVVGVSWYEASAYCKWLAQNWQKEMEAESLSSFKIHPSSLHFRLPREVEWAEAAGGDKDEKRYPWDEKKATEKLEEILKRANVAQSDIDRTTPVWMYPLGESIKGVMDMAGNVWEWQANYSGYEYSGPKALGLRGGLWFYVDEFARVAVRHDNLPYDWYDVVGFRVALPPSG